MFGTNPIFRFLNQNRRQIRITILAIVIFLLMLRFLNSLAEKQIEEKAVETNVYYTEYVVSNEYKSIIQRFLDFCKNGDESSAYALLSSECKESSFKTLSDFEQKYCKKYFSTTKKYTITYSTSSDKIYYYTVKILEDILATGKADDTSITQYFSVLKENGLEKITIEIY